MGLDNIPNNYPCMTRGTAVRVARFFQDGSPMLEEDGTTLLATDCKATQACGGCPYTSELEKQNKAELGNPVYGMFGTDCWYRGKYGNVLLEAIGVSDDNSFYGDNTEGTEKSAESCKELAGIIDQEIYDAEQNGNVLQLNGEDITPELKYASWYLKWASEYADGLVCWY